MTDATWTDGDAVAWDAGDDTYCGQVTAVLTDTARVQYLVHVFDTDANEFKDAAVRRPESALRDAADASDCGCGGDCQAIDATAEATETDDTEAADADADDDADDETESDETESVDSTCKATTADGSSCENEAGDDGYCHIPSHGPDDEDE